MSRRGSASIVAALMVALAFPGAAAAAAPEVVNDAASVAEDSGTTQVNVLGNDTYDATPNLAIIDVSTPSHGSATVNGLFVDYTPDADYHGPDSFTYRAQNDDGVSVATATVSLTVTSANDGPPDADNDSDATDEDVAKVIDVLANDADPDGGGLTITASPNGAHGLTTVVSAGTRIRYTPDADWNGSDTFTYTAQDEDGQTSSATVSITVDPVEDGPPEADDDTKAVAEEAGPTPVNVLANDDDPDPEQTLTITAKTNGTKGAVAITGGGTGLTYDPATDATGPDSFTYTVSDGHGGTDTATVDITITDVNDDPVADDDTATVAEGGSVDIDASANDDDPDGDTPILNTPSDPPHGSASIVSGKIRYVPDADFNGSDSFTYTVRDGHGGTSDPATVDVTVTPVNDAPVGVDDPATTSEDTGVDIDVRSNDVDIDGDTLTITDTSDPAHGTASIASGQVHYEPDDDYHGTDSFTYDVSDGNGGSASATVTVTIAAVNDAPVADDDAFTVAEDSLANPLLVLAGDEDVDGDTFMITAKTNGGHGTVAITNGGAGLTYKPNPNFSGIDTFTYVISDADLDSAPATVTVDVGGLNDAPVQANDMFDVPQGVGARPVDILTNDIDPDGDQLIIVGKTNGAHGTVTITGSGTGLTYNPAGTYKGADSFTYKVTDGNSLPKTAKVFVTVVPDTLDPVVTGPAQRFIGQTVGSSTTKVRISWGATDAGVGVASYKLQVSTNGGSYKTISLSKSTSTSVDRTLTTGRSYRFRVRATDKEGNVSSYRYGPTMTPTRYSQENSKVTYVGAWKKTTPSKALGGSARNATLDTKSVTFAFTGYDVGWITTRTTSSGKAQVFIDGAPITIIDLDTKSTAYRKLVFQRHFSVLGPHTITIAPIGDGRVDVDGFVVLK